MFKNGYPLFCFYSIGFFIVLVMSSLQAAVAVWTGAGTDNNWSTAANWSGSVTPGTTDTALFNSSTNKKCSVNVDVNIKRLVLESGWADTISQLSGKSVTIGTGGIYQSAGVFIGSDAQISTGKFLLSGGTFSAPAGNFIITDSGSSFTVSGGTFQHNNGTLCFNVQCGYDAWLGHKTTRIDVPSSGLALGSLKFTGRGSNTPYDRMRYEIVSDGIITVSGDFTVERDGTTLDSIYLMEGTIKFSGNNVINASYCSGGTMKLLVDGNASVQYSSSATGVLPRLLVNTTGTVSNASGSVDLSMSRFVLEAGTFSAPTGNLIVTDSGNSFTVTGGTFQHNNGTLCFNVQCGYDAWLGHRKTTINIPGGGINIGSLKFTGRGSNTPYDRMTYEILSGGVVTVNGNLTVERDGTTLDSIYLVGGVIKFSGNNVINANYCSGGTTEILVDGSSSVQYSSNAAGILPRLHINTTGAVSAIGEASNLAVSRFKLEAGTFSAPTGTLTITDSGSAFTVTNGIFQHNNGTLEFNIQCGYDVYFARETVTVAYP